MPSRNESASTRRANFPRHGRSARRPLLSLGLIAALGPVGSCANLEQSVVLLTGGFAEISAGIKGGAIVTLREDRGVATQSDRATLGAESPPSAPLASSSSKTNAAAGDADSVSDDTLREAKFALANLQRRGAVSEVGDEALGADRPSAAELYFVQIGSHQVMRAAESQLNLVRAGFPALISGFETRVAPVSMPTLGVFFRVQIGPIQSQGAALDLCRALKAQNQACFMLADAAMPAKQHRPHATFEGGWASIAPNPDPGEERRVAETSSTRAGVRAPQFADAFPVYTTPNLPGVIE